MTIHIDESPFEPILGPLRDTVSPLAFRIADMFLTYMCLAESYINETDLGLFASLSWSCEHDPQHSPSIEEVVDALYELDQIRVAFDDDTIAPLFDIRFPSDAKTAHRKQTVLFAPGHNMLPFIQRVRRGMREAALS